MNWVFYSLLMFTASVALYLTVRKSALLKTPVALTNLAMFGIPLIAYLAIGITLPQQGYSLSPLNGLLILFAATVFAYGGNTMSLRALAIAPNPGYSLVLSKSYVLFTTLVAVILLGAELTPSRAIAILLIVGFSILILVNRTPVRSATTNGWIGLSIGAFFAWGFFSLSIKYLLTHGVGTIAFLIYVYALATACIFIADRIRPASFSALRRQEKLLLIATGVFSTLFNFGQVEAIRLAPNVGYVNAINAASIALVTIFAVIIFKDALSKQKAIGIAGVTLGLILLLI